MGKITWTLLAFFVFAINSQAQDTEKKITATLGEGVVIAGYVDNGGFLNFTGPSLKLIHKPYVVWLGCLPSIRIKEDIVATGAKKNSVVTPSLGFGLTFAYKHLAVQAPMYYNAKNTTSDGNWNVGLGLGYKF
jgi:hypothetical protein